MQAHPTSSKQERKSLCRLIDSRKLSPEASLHAAQNERLPVRAVIQVLLSEQSRNTTDWSGSFSGARSPNLAGLDPTVRCLSKREMSAQQMEVRRLKDEVARLQSQCSSMQVQIERLVEKKKGLFKWRKLGMPSPFKSSSGAAVEKVEEVDHGPDMGFGQQTPVDLKTRLVRCRTPRRWRKSMS